MPNMIAHWDHGVALRLKQRVQRRTQNSEVPHIENHLHPRILGGQLAQQLLGPIRRGVVDEQYLPSHVRDPGHHRRDALVEDFDVTLLVVAGHHDANQGRLHHVDLPPSTVSTAPVI